MAVFTGRLTSVFEVLQGDQFAVLGRTVTYMPMTMKITAADRHNGQIFVLSGGVSAQAIALSPLGVSAPVRLLFFMADHPVDLRFNAASDAVFLSAVQQCTFGASLSNFFVTTLVDTTILLYAVGGSNATVTTSLPLP